MAGLLIVLILYVGFFSGTGALMAWIMSKTMGATPHYKFAMLISLIPFLGFIIVFMRSGVQYGARRVEAQRLQAEAARRYLGGQDVPPPAAR